MRDVVLSLQGIEQRRETMLKISNAILDCQREYFMNHKQLKPMTMQNIADDIEMHVSTVSRAVKGSIFNIQVERSE